MNSNRSSLPKDQSDAVKLSIQQKKYDRALELLNKISNKEDNLNFLLSKTHFELILNNTYYVIIITIEE